MACKKVLHDALGGGDFWTVEGYEQRAFPDGSVQRLPLGAFTFCSLKCAHERIGMSVRTVHAATGDAAKERSE